MIALQQGHPYYIVSFMPVWATVQGSDTTLKKSEREEKELSGNSRSEGEVTAKNLRLYFFIYT